MSPCSSTAEALLSLTFPGANMAAPGNKSGGPSKEDKESKAIKDDTIAKAAGAVIGVGIAWSLLKSLTGRGKKQQHLLTQEQVTKETATLGEGEKPIEPPAQDTIKEVEKEAEIVGSLEAAGKGFSHAGHKETQKAKLSKTVNVHKGDTLWGIAKKHGVSVESLVAANGIKDGHSIAAGETIVVPK